jgi:hypothetical protein
MKTNVKGWTWYLASVSLLFLCQIACTQRTQTAKVGEQQDLMVFRRGGETVVKGLENGKILRREGQADGALQWAVDQLAAQGGGEIELGSGVFVIQKPVQLASFIRLSGRGRATVLKLGPENKDGVLLVADAKEEIVLSDFMCQGVPGPPTSAGIVFNSVGDSEIRNVTARDFSGYGIWVRNNCFMNKIIGCTTLGNGAAGIYLAQNASHGRGGDFLPNLIEGCTSIGEEGNAFELSRSLCTNIVACLAHQPKGYGFYFHNVSNSTLLSGSRCFQGAKDAILVEDSHEINVSSNTICWNRGNGLELSHVVWGTVSGNNFIDSGASPNPLADGVYLHTDTKGVEITGNAIWNWPDQQTLLYGVYESADCLNNQITNNNINNFTKQAVFSAGKNTTVADNKGVGDPYWSGVNAKAFVVRPHREEPPFTSDRVTEFLKLTRR